MFTGPPLVAPRLPLIGREAELAAAKRLLSQTDTGLVTLTGAGGIGKTRLALQIALDLLAAGTFAERVYFLPLAPLPEARLLVPSLAQAFGVGEERGTALLESLAERLQGDGLLLVLDNFEHLMAAAGEVALLLARCPSLTLLVTSRERLGVQAEQVVVVPPLGLPEAVRLFMIRAQAAAPDFALSPEALPAVGDLCRRLDALPLAIELAAARVSTLSPQLLLHKLEQLPGLLAGGSRDLPPRLQTLSAAVAWSYDLLSEQEQRLLRELAVFGDSWSAEAAEAVSEREDALLLLCQLVNKSLVVTVPGVADGPRFRLLSSIRHYALARLRETAQEEASARAAHSAYFLALLAAEEGALRSHRQQEALSRLEEVMADVRSAWLWAAEARRLDLLAKAVEALWLVYAHRGLHSEAERLCAEAAAVTRSRDPEALKLRAKVLRGQGAACFRLGFFERASALLGESVRLFRGLGISQETAFSLNQLAAALHLEGRYPEEKRVLEESLRLSAGPAGRWLYAYSLNDLGFVSHLLGDAEAAERLSRQSLEVFQALNDQRGVAFALHNLGVYAAFAGDASGAAALHQRSLELRQKNGDAWGAAASHLALASLRLGPEDTRFLLAAALQGALAIRALPLVMGALCELAAHLMARRGVNEPSQTRVSSPNDRSKQPGENPGAPHPCHVPSEAAHALLAVALHHPAAQFAVRERAARLQAALAPSGARVLSEDIARACALVREALGLPGEVAANLRAQLENALTPPGGSHHKSPEPYPDDLTAREVEVLRLVAQGLSNQAIADALRLSPRTVERHISSVYEKIGAGGKVARAAATAYAFRHGIIPD